MTDEPILRCGDAGEWVSHLQRLLAKAGHDPGPVDGEFGDRTQMSVRAYQKALGLVVDGVIGADTWFNLHLPSATSATAARATTRPARSADADPGDDRWAGVVRTSAYRRLRMPAVSIR